MAISTKKKKSEPVRTKTPAATHKKSSSHSQPSLTDGLRLIDDIITILRQTGEPDTVLREAMKALNRIASFDAASLYLKNTESGKYEEIVSIGSGVATLDFVSLSTGKGIAGLTASTRKPIYLSERSRSRHFDPEQSFSSVLSIPLLAGEELIGVLNLGAKPSHAFSETAIQLFTALSGHLAIAIERYSLQRNLLSLERQLQQAFEKTETFARQMGALTEIKQSAEQRKRSINDINNALEVILGSIQMLLFQRSAVDQKMLSQLRRSEQAAMRIQSTLAKLDLAIDETAHSPLGKK